MNNKKNSYNVNLFDLLFNLINSMNFTLKYNTIIKPTKQTMFEDIERGYWR